MLTLIFIITAYVQLIVADIENNEVFISSNEDVNILMEELRTAKEFGKSRGKLGLLVSTSSSQTDEFLAFLQDFVYSKEGAFMESPQTPFLILDMDVCTSIISPFYF